MGLKEEGRNKLPYCAIGRKCVCKTNLFCDCNLSFANASNAEVHTIPKIVESTLIGDCYTLLLCTPHTMLPLYAYEEEQIHFHY